jgi:hypothetical protein
MCTVQVKGSCDSQSSVDEKPPQEPLPLSTVLLLSPRILSLQTMPTPQKVVSSLTLPVFLSLVLPCMHVPVCLSGLCAAEVRSRLHTPGVS